MNYKFFLKLPSTDTAAVNGFITFECLPKVKSDDRKITWQEEKGQAYYRKKMSGIVFTGEMNPNSPWGSDFNAVKNCRIFDFAYMIVRSTADNYATDAHTMAFKPNTGKWDERLKTVEVNMETNEAIDRFLKYQYRDIDLYAYKSTVATQLSQIQTLFVWTYTDFNHNDTFGPVVFDSQVSIVLNSLKPNVLLPYSTIIGKYHWNDYTKPTASAAYSEMVTYVLVTDTAVAQLPPNYIYPGTNVLVGRFGMELTVYFDDIIYEGNVLVPGSTFTPTASSSTAGNFSSTGNGTVAAAIDRWDYVDQLYAQPYFFQPSTQLQFSTTYRVFNQAIQYNGMVYQPGEDFITSVYISPLINQSILYFQSLGDGTGCVFPISSPAVKLYLTQDMPLEANTTYKVMAGSINYDGAVYGTGQTFVTNSTALSFTERDIYILGIRIPIIATVYAVDSSGLQPLVKIHRYCKKPARIVTNWSFMYPDTFDQTVILTPALTTPSTNTDLVLLETFSDGSPAVTKYVYYQESSRLSFDTLRYVGFSPARSLFASFDYALKQLGWAGLRSHFLTDDTNYVTGQANRLKNLVLWQKSDVKNYQATQRASRCMISLEKLLSSMNAMLWMQWYIDTDNYLVWEHQLYFDRQVTAIDLSNVPTVETAEEYSFTENTYPLYEKYSFAEGKNNNSYVTRYDALATDRDNSTSRSVDLVVTDIDEILASPTSFSDDGIVLGIVENGSIASDIVHDIVVDAVAIPSYTGATITVPPTGSVISRNMLNGYLLWPNIIQNFGRYFRYQLTFRGGEFNQTGYVSQSIARIKKQEPIFLPVKYLSTPFDPKTQGFITHINSMATDIHVKEGKVETADLSLDTDILTLNLIYAPQ